MCEQCRLLRPEKEFELPQAYRRAADLLDGEGYICLFRSRASDEKVYRCLTCGAVWTIGAPNFPLRGYLTVDEAAAQKIPVCEGYSESGDIRYRIYRTENGLFDVYVEKLVQEWYEDDDGQTYPLGEPEWEEATEGRHLASELDAAQAIGEELMRNLG